MNLKEIDFVYQTLLKSEIEKIDLSESIISSNEWANSLQKFQTITNIYLLRNFVSNFKKTIELCAQINPDDPYLYMIMKGLIIEILYGKQLEIKGSLRTIMGLITEKQENVKQKVNFHLLLK